jgi:hypothetical protein
MENKLRWYYTEYPMWKFVADNDEEALNRTNAKVVYREDDTSPDGIPFVILRNIQD